MEKKFVYVLSSSGGLSKIGISKSPEVRCAAITTGSGYKANIEFLFGPFYAASSIESFVKSHLAEHRAFGEWFSCSASALADAVRFRLQSFKDVTPEAGIDPDQLFGAFRGNEITGMEIAEAAMSRYANLVESFAALERDFSEATAMMEFYRTKYEELRKSLSDR